MLSITPAALQARLSKGEEILLVDVREQVERDIYNIGGIHIPLSVIFENIAIIPTDRTVVFYCQKGIRSQIAIQRLQQKFSYNNLVNLGGGMEAWKLSAERSSI